MLVPSSNDLPKELALAIQNVYKPAGIKVSKVLSETESTPYGACRLELNGYTIAFRIAKTRPTKVGKFVTVWKRPAPDSPIAPLDSSDGIAFLVVHVCDAMHAGQFVFSQQLLVAKGIMFQHGKGGKLAFPIYPSWSNPTAKIALRAQEWQCQYFFSIAKDRTVDFEQVTVLF